MQIEPVYSGTAAAITSTKTLNDKYSREGIYVAEGRMKNVVDVLRNDPLVTLYTQ